VANNAREQAVVCKECTYDIILGIKFLNKYKAVVDFEKGMMMVNAMKCESVLDIVNKMKGIMVYVGAKWIGSDMKPMVIDIKKSCKPVIMRPYRNDIMKRDITRKLVDDFVHKGIVEPVDRVSWAAPVVLQKKSNGDRCQL
jgi:hypothetical protein